jgi:ribosome maturation factor RimP
MPAADRHASTRGRRKSDESTPAATPVVSSPAGAGSPGSSRAEAELHDRLEPLVAGLGFDLEEVRVSRVGRRTLVKVVVDADGGLELDDVADVSRAVDAHLDADDPFAGPFVLEVSSPGVDRPLTEPRHWRRNVHRLVQVEHGGAPLTARVVAVDDDGVTLRVEGPQAASAPTTIHAPYGQLGPGRVQVEFNRPTSAQTYDDDHDDQDHDHDDDDAQEG